MMPLPLMMPLMMPLLMTPLVPLTAYRCPYYCLSLFPLMPLLMPLSAPTNPPSISTTASHYLSLVSRTAFHCAAQAGGSQVRTLDELEGLCGPRQPSEWTQEDPPRCYVPFCAYPGTGILCSHCLSTCCIFRSDPHLCAAATALCCSFTRCLQPCFHHCSLIT